jgi:hypothetical protein
MHRSAHQVRVEGRTNTAQESSSILIFLDFEEWT